MGIKIEDTDRGFFFGLEFEDEIGNIDVDWSAQYWNGYICENCGVLVADCYGEIIDALYKANLLPEDFEMQCCQCM